MKENKIEPIQNVNAIGWEVRKWYQLNGDQATMVGTLLSTLLIGAQYKEQKLQTKQKHIFHILIGSLICYLSVGIGFQHMILLGTVIYIYLRISLEYFRKSIPSEITPSIALEHKNKLYKIGFVGMVLSMGYLSLAHIYRVYSGWETISQDFTAPLMVLVLKLSSYTWSRIDGEIDVYINKLQNNEEEHKSIINTIYKNDSEYVLKYRKENIQTNDVDLLEYYGWIFFFPGVIIGPAILYKEYIGYIDGSLYKNKFNLDTIPNTWNGIKNKLKFAALACIGVYIDSFFPKFNYISTLQYYIDLPTKYQRLQYCLFSSVFAHWKYYFVWYLSEASCIAAGFGLSVYKPEKGIIEWNSLQNVDLLNCEFSPSISYFAKYWNIRVSEILKQTIYLRINNVPKYLKNIMPLSAFSSICTKFVIAFWHGFYPGYYMFFLQTWFIQEMEIVVRLITLQIFENIFTTNQFINITQTTTTKSKKILEQIYRKPNVAKSLQRVYSIFIYLFILFCMRYSAIPFYLLYWKGSIDFYMDTYFFVHILGIFMLCMRPIQERYHQRLHSSSVST